MNSHRRRRQFCFNSAILYEDEQGAVKASLGMSERISLVHGLGYTPMSKPCLEEPLGFCKQSLQETLFSSCGASLNFHVSAVISLSLRED
jgi:hypothetical protein